MVAGEKQLIERIRRVAGASRDVVAGIGDDCAVLRVTPGRQLLVTTDFTLENVHFRRDWHSADWVGRRCLTRGLSDIAAMGGEPLAAFLSLAIGPDLPPKWVDRFLKGLLHLAAEFRVPLAGGDTAQSPAGLQADIVVLGTVPRGKAILRSGARPGEYVYVTGSLGGSAALLDQLKQSRRSRVAHSRQLERQPRLGTGQWLSNHAAASAMIDVSDGLSTDLDHICHESHVGAVIEAASIPRARIARLPVPLEFALHGGDDYELLFTSPRVLPAKIAGVPLSRIGRITKSRGMRLIGPDGVSRSLKPGGWQHFRGK